jgi:hypothetical protein
VTKVRSCNHVNASLQDLNPAPLPIEAEKTRIRFNSAHIVSVLMRQIVYDIEKRHDKHDPNNRRYNDQRNHYCGTRPIGLFCVTLYINWIALFRIKWMRFKSQCKVNQQRDDDGTDEKTEDYIATD